MGLAAFILNTASAVLAQFVSDTIKESKLKTTREEIEGMVISFLRREPMIWNRDDIHGLIQSAVSEVFTISSRHPDLATRGDRIELKSPTRFRNPFSAHKEHSSTETRLAILDDLVSQRRSELVEIGLDPAPVVSIPEAAEPQSTANSATVTWILPDEEHSPPEHSSDSLLQGLENRVARRRAGEKLND